MASTDDMAPNRSTPAAAGPHNGPRRSTARAASTRAASTRASARAREEELSSQVQQLQTDIKSITTTLTRLAEGKVNEAQSVAKREARNLARTGQNAVEDIQDEFGQIERQIKDTIREKPLTAVAGALALGFILAVVTR